MKHIHRQEKLSRAVLLQIWIIYVPYMFLIVGITFALASLACSLVPGGRASSRHAWRKNDGAQPATFGWEQLFHVGMVTSAETFRGSPLRSAVDFLSRTPKWVARALRFLRETATCAQMFVSWTSERAITAAGAALCVIGVATARLDGLAPGSTLSGLTIWTAVSGTLGPVRAICLAVRAVRAASWICPLLPLLTTLCYVCCPELLALLIRLCQLFFAVWRWGRALAVHIQTRWQMLATGAAIGALSFTILYARAWAAALEWRAPCWVQWAMLSSLLARVAMGSAHALGVQTPPLLERACRIVQQTYGSWRWCKLAATIAGDFQGGRTAAVVFVVTLSLTSLNTPVLGSILLKLARQLYGCHNATTLLLALLWAGVQLSESRGWLLQRPLASSAPDAIQLLVRPLHGSTQIVRVPASWTGGEVLQLLAAFERIPAALLRVTCNGRRLRQRQSLLYQGIPEDSTLHVSSCLLAGMKRARSPPVPADEPTPGELEALAAELPTELLAAVGEGLPLEEIARAVHAVSPLFETMEEQRHRHNRDSQRTWRATQPEAEAEERRMRHREAQRERLATQPEAEAGERRMHEREAQRQRRHPAAASRLQYLHDQLQRQMQSGEIHPVIDFAAMIGLLQPDGRFTDDVSQADLLCGKAWAAGGLDQRRFPLGAGFQTDVDLACALHADMRQRLPLHVCVSCARFCADAESSVREWRELQPLAQLLRTDVTATEEVPREALTVYERRRLPGESWRAPPPAATVYKAKAHGSSAETMTSADTLELPVARYCMRVLLADSDAAEHNAELNEDGQPLHMRVCTDCFEALKHGHVPQHSLARFDTGDVPNDLLQLGRLTYLESRLLAQWQLWRSLYVIQREGEEWRPSETLQQALRGHCILFENAPPEQLLEALAQTLPMRPAELAKYVQIVFLDAVGSREELVRKAQHAKCLLIRAEVVIRWAIHLSCVWRIPLDEEAITRARGALGAWGHWGHWEHT